MRENAFQAKLIKDLKLIFPNSVILKNDSSYMQGIPDLTIFNGNKWAMLECKKGAKDSHQPNQDMYVDRLNQMSYAAFIYPENREEVIEELKLIFE